MTKLGNQPQTPSDQNDIVVRSPVSHAKYDLSGGTVKTLYTSPTTIHSCSSAALDEIYLWASCTGSSDAKVYVTVGDEIVLINEIASQAGMVQIYPGVPHQGTVVKAYSNLASSIKIVGYVQRHYPISDFNNSLGYDGTE